MCTLLNFQNLKIFCGLGKALSRQSPEELGRTVPPAKGLVFSAKILFPRKANIVLLGVVEGGKSVSYTHLRAHET